MLQGVSVNQELWTSPTRQVYTNQSQARRCNNCFLEHGEAKKNKIHFGKTYPNIWSALRLQAPILSTSYQVSNLVVVDSVGRVAELVFHQRTRPPHSLSEVLRNRHAREIEKADFTCGVVQHPNDEITSLTYLDHTQHVWEQV